MSGIRFSLHANEAWARLTLIHPVELFTFRNGECRHKYDFYMPPTWQIKQTKTASTHDCEMELSSEQNDFAFGTVKVPFASYGHRSRIGRRAVTDYSPGTCSPHAAFAEIFLQMVSNYELLSYDNVYIFRHMSIYVIYISVVFIKFMLLFTTK